MRFGISGERFALRNGGSVSLSLPVFDLSGYLVLVIGIYALSIRGRVLAMDNPDV